MPELTICVHQLRPEHVEVRDGASGLVVELGPVGAIVASHVDAIALGMAIVEQAHRAAGVRVAALGDALIDEARHRAEQLDQQPEAYE
jgi:hypothetical protein